MNRQAFMKTARDRALNEVFPHYAWPGGYKVLYLDKEGNTLCPACVHEEASGRMNEWSGPYTPFIHYEGAAEYCEGCSKFFESEYGDPDKENGGRK
jgi:hypothetical protein